MDELNLEQVRATAQLLGYAIKQLDDLSDALIEARWKFEMIRRKPELGVVNVAGQTRKITSEQLRNNMRDLEEQQKVATDVLLYLSGVDTVDAARQQYLRLMTDYQRYGALRDLQRSADAGFAEAKETLAKEVAGSSAVEAWELVAEAQQRLATTVATVKVPDVSALEMTSLRLP